MTRIHQEAGQNIKKTCAFFSNIHCFVYVICSASKERIECKTFDVLHSYKIDIYRLYISLIYYFHDLITYIYIPIFASFASSGRSESDNENNLVGFELGQIVGRQNLAPCTRCWSSARPLVRTLVLIT